MHTAIYRKPVLHTYRYAYICHIRSYIYNWVSVGTYPVKRKNVMDFWAWAELFSNSRRPSYYPPPPPLVPAFPFHMLRVSYVLRSTHETKKRIEFDNMQYVLMMWYCCSSNRAAGAEGNRLEGIPIIQTDRFMFIRTYDYMMAARRRPVCKEACSLFDKGLHVTDFQITCYIFSNLSMSSDREKKSIAWEWESICVMAWRLIYNQEAYFKGRNDWARTSKEA